MERLSDVNKAYLRDKGLNDHEIEQVGNFLLQVFDAVSEKLVARSMDNDNVVRFRNSGGIEIRKTKEAAVYEAL